VLHFRTRAGPTGSGKTRAATTFACERLSRNVRSTFIQPTIALCKQTSAEARVRFPAVNGRTRTIVSRRGSDDKIVQRITKYPNDRNEAGDLLLVTHAGFLRRPHWHRADKWHLFVDEATEVAYHRQFHLKKHRQPLLDLFEVRPSGHELYAVLNARDHDQSDEALAQMKDDEIYRHFGLRLAPSTRSLEPLC
jgi:RAD3-like DEAD/DEAH box helicase